MLTVILLPAARLRAFDCPPTPTVFGNGALEGPVTPDGQFGSQATLSVDGEGRFVIAWRTPVVQVGDDSFNDIRAGRFDAAGLCVDCSVCPAFLTDSTVLASWQHPSIALSRGDAPDSFIGAVWIGLPANVINVVNPNRVYSTTFTYTLFDPRSAS